LVPVRRSRLAPWRGLVTVSSSRSLATSPLNDDTSLPGRSGEHSFRWSWGHAYALTTGGVSAWGTVKSLCRWSDHHNLVWLPGGHDAFCRAALPLSCTALTYLPRCGLPSPQEDRAGAGASWTAGSRRCWSWFTWARGRPSPSWAPGSEWAPATAWR